jgi:hypothetical protein
MKNLPNPTIELIRADMTPGFKQRYKFDTKQEAKMFFDKMKAEMNKLPEYLRPKI